MFGRVRFFNRFAGKAHEDRRPRKMSEGPCGNLFDNTVYVGIALPHVVAGAADHSQQPDSIRHAHQHKDIEHRPSFEGCDSCTQEAPPIGRMQPQQHIAKRARVRFGNAENGGRCRTACQRARRWIDRPKAQTAAHGVHVARGKRRARSEIRSNIRFPQANAKG